MDELEHLKFCAKYPFSKQAKEHINYYNVNFEKIDVKTLELAVERIKKAVEGNSPVENFKAINSTKMMEYLSDLLITYPVANALVSLNGDFFIKKRYARAIADNIYYFLQMEKQEIVEELASDFNIKKQGDYFLISLVEYSNNVPRDPDYRLIKMPVKNGFVRIDVNALAKLVAESIFESIMKLKVDKKMVPESFLEYSKLLDIEKKIAEEMNLGPLDTNAFPPCMKKIVSDLSSDNKVAHLPRFVLSTFFASINMEPERALEYFRTQENFDEKKTMYYLKHSYGDKGGVKYSAPACAKMISYGLCFKDETCHWPHPVMYYKNKRGRK